MPGKGSRRQAAGAGARLTVLQVVDKVDHLVPEQVAAVHRRLAVKPRDEARGGAVLAPDGGERVLDALEPP